MISSDPFESPIMPVTLLAYVREDVRAEHTRNEENKSNGHDTNIPKAPEIGGVESSPSIHVLSDYT
jgi:hypothetical protein